MLAGGSGHWGHLLGQRGLLFRDVRARRRRRVLLAGAAGRRLQRAERLLQWSLWAARDLRLSLQPGLPAGSPGAPPSPGDRLLTPATRTGVTSDLAVEASRSRGPPSQQR